MVEHALYRKFRPKTFEEYKGDFIKTCVNRFEKPEKRPQVILLYGPHGCGKTTACRLLTGFYLCESPVDGKPCGKCAGCKQVLDLIESGEDDLSCESVVEINGSENNRVDDIRKLMKDSMLTLPMASKYKVFIIDECHRITPEAQNALLKILEDIPEHLVIIFATTEKDKLLPTILSRCQMKLEVRRQTVANMTDILVNIATKEKIAYSKSALQLIAKKGGRIPRDCINMLEDIAASYGKVSLDNVLEYTADKDNDIYLHYIQAAHKGLADILTFMSEFTESDMTYQKFVSGLSRFVLNAVYIRMGIMTDFDASYIKMIKSLFTLYSVNEFHVLLHLIDDALKRVESDDGAVELTLSVLALNIGDITNKKNTVTADTMKEQTEKENSIGAKKFAEREQDIHAEEVKQKPKGLCTVDEFLEGLDVVEYENN